MSESASRPGGIEGFLRRDRQVVVTALIVITAFAWAYLVMLTNQMGMTLAGDMKDMASVMSLKPWSASDAFFMFGMWAVMMVGMMTPSAAPMILLYALVLRKRYQSVNAVRRTSFFFAGYAAVWVGFSAAATTAQWGLEQAALLSPMMMSTSTQFGGIVLIVAGLYQWAPYKDVCLKRCREPVWFLSRIWHDGDGGAFLMGVSHGVYCLGCCWALMALLFVSGVMNLLCIAAITVFVLLEKVTPFGRGFGRVGALALIGFGIFVMISGSSS